MALSPQQEDEPVEYARTGNGHKSAVAVGYSEAGAYTQAYRLLRNAEILARVEEEQALMLADQRAQLQAMANDALVSLAESIRDTQPGSMARVKACELVLDRSGHKPAETITADLTTHDDIPDEKAAEVVRTAKAGGNIVALCGKVGGKN